MSESEGPPSALASCCPPLHDVLGARVLPDVQCACARARFLSFLSLCSACCCVCEVWCERRRRCSGRAGAPFLSCLKCCRRVRCCVTVLWLSCNQPSSVSTYYYASTGTVDSMPSSICQHALYCARCWLPWRAHNVCFLQRSHRQPAKEWQRPLLQRRAGEPPRLPPWLLTAMTQQYAAECIPVAHRFVLSPALRTPGASSSPPRPARACSSSSSSCRAPPRRPGSRAPPAARPTRCTPWAGRSPAQRRCCERPALDAALPGRSHPCGL